MAGACAIAATAVAFAAGALVAPDAGLRTAERASISAPAAAVSRTMDPRAIAPPSRVGPTAAAHRTATARTSACHGEAPSPRERQISRRQWLGGVVITEYYPAPERWFVGRRVSAPGLEGAYAVDWLYSARGLAMEGEGVDRGGRPFHIAELGSTGWVNAAGHPTLPVCLGKWTDGPPTWLRGGWRNARGAVTFPLASGGWSDGVGRRSLPYGGVTFAPGSSRPLRYYHSIAVDPGLIPLGSRVYIPAYRDLGGGWFLAQDTGGAIKGPHVDVYRPAPPRPADEGRYMTGQRIYVIPPGG
jgi:3D (Asp-Asp-Asp) domain-containing protein